MRLYSINKCKFGIALVMQLYSVCIFAQWSGGAGSVIDPYKITTVSQLTNLQTTTNSGTNYTNVYFKLMNNLNLEGNTWTPIGTSAKPFRGNFDGNNHTISGLFINTGINDVGLFGCITSGTISNLGVTTSPTGVTGNNNVAILAGSQNGGTISNCYVMGSVSGNDVIGGLVGNQSGTIPVISKCFALVNVTGMTNTNGVGGLVGVVRGNLNNSYAWGEVTGINPVGGLVGTASSNSTINASYTTSYTLIPTLSKLGGLIGNMSQQTATIRNCVALNKTLNSLTSANRIAGAKNSYAVTENNYASDELSININKKAKVITSDSNSLEGGTQSAASLMTQAFYSNTVSWSISNANDNNKSWNIWENTNLPYLQTQSSPVANVYASGTTLQGIFRPDVSMDSILIYGKNGTMFILLGTASVNNANHTWTYSDPVLAMNAPVYILAYESGKSMPSYPVTYIVCGLPVTFDAVEGTTYTSALDLQTCIKNLQNAVMSDVQFSKAGGTAFDANIISSPATYSVSGTQVIYARATSSSGCQSEIKSFKVKQIGSLLFKEDFGSGEDCSKKGLGSDITTYVFGGDLYTNGNYSICSQLSDYYDGYLYCKEASYDHTDPGKGRSLIVNADYTAGKFYTLTIKNLCPGTHLYFSAWVFNLVNPYASNTKYYTDRGTVFKDPDVRFELTDGTDGTLLAEYNTGDIPKVIDPVTNWRPYGFDFTTGLSSSVVLTLYNNGPGGNGNDLMIDDIEVYASIPPVVIDGPSYYCPGDPVNLTVKDLDKTPFSENVKVCWLFSENGNMGVDSKWDTIPNMTSVNLNIPFQKSGYLRVIVGSPGAIDEKLFNCCSMSEPKPILITPDLMYWKKNTSDNDWNNPDNWVDANGSPLNTIPGKCTDVHIPGNADYYPSLDNGHTFRTETYGEPKCRDITYHFGSEVAKPHYLDYRKAYIQYNFGYYEGSNYVPDGEIYSAKPMERGHWYVLSAPLKNIVSGDFSVGGFPNMWQQGFKSSLDRTGTLSGDWYTPENTAALEIGARQNYAISVWAGELLPGVLGEDDHKNMNALKGILEMPYFENATISNNHRIHEYSTADSTSRFYYYFYDRAGLPVSKSVYDNFQRGSSSYRFVFEDNNNKPMTDFAVNVPAGTEIMIGNPFISSLDFQNFYNRNSAVLEDYYRLFVKNNFMTYSLSGGSPAGLTNNIASFQGFFVKTKGSTGSTTLHFPISASVTRPSRTTHQLRSNSSAIDNKIYINASNSQGNSWATVIVNKDVKKEDVPQLFITSPESKDVPQIYTVNTHKAKNVIQYVSGEYIEVPLGITCGSKDMIQISFSNLENSDYESLTLIDNQLNKTINLLEENNYSFKNNPDAGERFLLRIGSKANVVTAVDQVTNESGFRIYVHENILEVNSSENISMIDIYTIQGVKVLSSSGINTKNYTRKIQLPAGIYIVTTKLVKGELKTEKIIIK